jgi:hypothetical protein
MTTQQTLGPVQVMGTSLVEINDALRQIQKRIDALAGLNGRVTIHDRVGVDDAVVDTDAVNQGTLNGYRATVAPPKVTDASAVGAATTFAKSDHTHQGVNLDVAQTITGAKTVTGVLTVDGVNLVIKLGATAGLKILDPNGHLLHCFGDPA